MTGSAIDGRITLGLAGAQLKASALVAILTDSDFGVESAIPGALNCSVEVATKHICSASPFFASLTLLLVRLKRQPRLIPSQVPLLPACRGKSFGMFL